MHPELQLEDKVRVEEKGNDLIREAIRETGGKEDDIGPRVDESNNGVEIGPGTEETIDTSPTG